MASNRRSYPRWLREDKLDEYDKTIEEVESRISQMQNEFEVAKKITRFIQGKPIKEQEESSPQINNSTKDKPSSNHNNTLKSTFIKSMDITKKTKSFFDSSFSDIDGAVGIVKKVGGFTQKNLRRNNNLSKFIRNNLSVKAGNLAENTVNLAGRVAKKDLKKYASAAKQLTNAGIKKTLLGKTSARQLTNLRRNRITKKIIDTVGPKKIGSMYGKFKDGVDKAFKLNLDDGVSFIGKGMKKITNPKVTGIMKKVGDLKLSGALKKAAGSNVGQAFMKSFSIGNAMNLHSVMTEESEFKKLLAGADIAGDFVSKLPGPVAKAVGLGTSTLNFVGGLTYDVLDSKFMERFGGKKATAMLDEGAGFITKPLEKGIKAAFNFGKSVKNKVVSGVKGKIDAIKKNPIKEAVKIFNPVGYGAFKLGEKALKTYGPRNSKELNPIKDKISNGMKMKINAIKKDPAKEIAKLGASVAMPGAFGVFKAANMLKEKLFKASPSRVSKPKDGLGKSVKGRSKGVKLNSNVIDIYNNSKNVKNNNVRKRLNDGILEAKLTGSNKSSSNKNNFTININGSSLSVDEMANELASKIKLTMENVYA